MGDLTRDLQVVLYWGNISTICSVLYKNKSIVPYLDLEGSLRGITSDKYVKWEVVAGYEVFAMRPSPIPSG